MFSHGWPLSADDWEPAMLFFLEHGCRVIAHDRRGHRRPPRPAVAMTWIIRRRPGGADRVSTSRRLCTSAAGPAAANVVRYLGRTARSAGEGGAH